MHLFCNFCLHTKSYYKSIIQFYDSSWEKIHKCLYDKKMSESSTSSLNFHGSVNFVPLLCEISI